MDSIRQTPVLQEQNAKIARSVLSLTQRQRYVKAARPADSKIKAALQVSIVKFVGVDNTQIKLGRDYAKNATGVNFSMMLERLS
jgi:hypothetical protein